MAGRFEINGLLKILKAVKAKPLKIQIGILAGHSVRAEGALTNAEVGAAHEFGTSKLPQRSFLRMPLTTRLNQNLKKSNLFDEKLIKKMIKQGTMLPWADKVAVVALRTVQDAFDTGGFGLWPAWKNPSYTNNTGMLLVDTQQLRNSIQSRIVK